MQMLLCLTPDGAGRDVTRLGFDSDIFRAGVFADKLTEALARIEGRSENQIEVVVPFQGAEEQKVMLDSCDVVQIIEKLRSLIERVKVEESR